VKRLEYKNIKGGEEGRSPDEGVIGSRKTQRSCWIMVDKEREK